VKPFFCFFGGKWRCAPRYPAPEYPLIVEPFAGGAGYATRYSERQVTLCEADPVISALWRYLIRVKASEVRRLPDIQPGQDVRTLTKLPAEARSLIGFWLNKGTNGPRNIPSRWMRDGTRPNSFWGPVIRARIAEQVDGIRHWKVLDIYSESPNLEATWFVDPPYQVAGTRYRYHDIDYTSLGRWCRARRGQVMVCENAGASWLPFEPHITIKALEGRGRAATSVEVLWQGGIK